MTPRPDAMRRRRRGRLTAGLALAAMLLIVPGGAIADAGTPSAAPSASHADRWDWPVHPFRVERPFVAPPHRYGPGHRGIDLRPLGGGDVRSPASGVIAFSGQVAGRGVVTIDHGDGLVTTLEPLEPELAPGTPVERGAVVGALSTGGHTEPGVLHFGVRLDGEYINPLVLLGGVPRAVLLPCC
jgi:murein DD-endopeptidase MepM/ murein hydrolase activator NlpD